MDEATAHKFATYGTRAIVIADVQDEKGQNAVVSRRPSLSDLARHHLTVQGGCCGFEMVLWILRFGMVSILGWCCGFEILDGVDRFEICG
ncbi:hypothetical protein SO802_001421 [Lithocarpus litseifolius]|uniref:Uncharacterized protein n=1 Tax=Lithocarpus litseifolius TaxID=425828 RepID=A0AAW2DUU8_9ROSI